MTLNRLILPTRLPPRATIRTGEQVPTRGGKTRPSRLDTFRITGPELVVREAADLWGGTPRAWEDAPTPGEWEVTTEASFLPVAVPLAMPDVIDRAWEQWTAGGRTHRCDGQTCEHTRLDDGQAVVETIPCTCDPDNPACKPTTRLRVQLVDLTGLGVDRIVTHSVHAAMELMGVIEFLRLSGAPGLVQATLRIDQREVKRTGEQTKRFPVVVLDPHVRVRDLLGGPGGTPQAALPESAGRALPAGLEADPPAPPAEPTITQAQRKRLFAIAKAAGVGNDDLRQMIEERTGDESTTSLTIDDYDALCGELQALANQPDEDAHEPAWMGDPGDPQPPVIPGQETLA